MRLFLFTIGLPGDVTRHSLVTSGDRHNYVTE